MTGLLPSTRRSLDAFLSERQSRFRVPSVMVAVLRGGDEVYTAGRGTIDARPNGPQPGPDTQYRIGSITKTFVAAAVLQLVEEHLVDLDDRIGAYLPELAHFKVTVAQLLSQSSGITAESPGLWWERTPGVAWDELAAQLVPGHQVLPAGAYFHYSNVAFGILGRLIEVTREAGWFDVVRAQFLQPLGMGRTSFLPEDLAAGTAAPGLAVHPWADLVQHEMSHDGRAMAPAGQIWSTVTDLGVWGRFLSGATQGILSPVTVASMHKIRSVDDGDTWISGYGLGLQVSRHEGRRIWGHSGSMPGFVSGLWIDEKTDLIAVFLCNSTSGPGPGFATELLDVIVSAEPVEVAPWVPATPAPGLIDLIGPWFWGTAQFTLTIEGADTLLLDPVSGTGRGARFRQDGQGRWIGDSGYYFGEELAVVREEGGRVNHLNLNTFVLTRTPYAEEAPIPGGLDARGWHAPS